MFLNISNFNLLSRYSNENIYFYKWQVLSTVEVIDYGGRKSQATKVVSNSQNAHIQIEKYFLAKGNLDTTP